MRIAYVNIWAGFDQNDYPTNGCWFSRVLREIDPNLIIDVGYDPAKKYDLVISMFAPNPHNSSMAYADLSHIDAKKLCFTGESYDLVKTTPHANAYIGFDDESRIIGDFKYLRFPLYAIYHANNLDRYGCSSFEELRDKLRSRDRLSKISAVVSNPNNQLRTSILHTLIQHGLCDSGGRVYNTIGAPIDDKLAFVSKYTIGMAFENMIKTSYITEKIYEVFCVGSIPFYYGAEDVVQEFNPNSFLRLDVTNEQTMMTSLQDAVSVLSDPDRIHKMMAIDPISGYRAEKYIRNGKQIFKEFIMNIVESK